MDPADHPFPPPPDSPIAPVAPVSPPNDVWPIWLTPSVVLSAGLLVIGGLLLVAPGIAYGVGYASIAALLLVIIPIAALIMGDPAQRRRWLILALVLAVLGTGGFFGGATAARGFAKVASARGAYAFAVNELHESGYSAPYSQELAQTYLDWAEAEVRARAFGPAIDHLTLVATRYPTTPQAARAHARLPEVHRAWADDAATHNDPIRAGQEYQIVLTQYLASPAAVTARNHAAPAFVAWAAALHDGQDYAGADAVYQVLFKTYGTDALASQTRPAAAQNLLDWAKQLAHAGIYDLAAQHYQELVASYPETAAAALAKATLNQGTTVIGQLLKADGKTPVYADTTIRLSSQWTVQADGTYQVGGQHYLANTDEKGYFAVPNVAPGRYLIEWRGPIGEFLTYFKAGQPQLLVTVITLRPPVLAAITTDQP